MTEGPAPPFDFGHSAASPMPHTFFAAAAAPALLPRSRLSSAHIAVLDFWLSANGGAPPSRAMINPARIQRALPSVILWAVLPNDAGYRCRLAGTAICDAAGRELRGMSLEDVHGLGSEIAREEFNRVRDRREAHFVECTMNWVTRPYRLYKRLLLPLVHPNGTVDSLLGVITIE